MVGETCNVQECGDMSGHQPKRVRELKAQVKCGKRAPVPFPSKVVVESGDNFKLKSYIDGVAVFGEKGEVRVCTTKKDGSVGGLPCVVDLIISITYMDNPVHCIEGRVSESY
eukprot:7387261-Prymnesium_polylepis.1